MAGAEQKPFDPGRFPMTEKQWKTMAAVTAELCRAYDIEVIPRKVLGHGEVERNLGVRQKGKWDPMVLPWAPDLTVPEVGNLFRELVKSRLTGDTEDETLGAAIGVTVDGKTAPDAVLANGDIYLTVASLVKNLGWMLLNASQDYVVFFPESENEPIYLPHEFLDEDITIADDAREAEIQELLMAQGYVQAKDLAEALNLAMDFDSAESQLTIGEKKEKDSQPTPSPLNRVVIKSGDTLSAIAARHLGSAGLWRKLLKPDRETFTDQEARKIKPGDVVLIPIPTASEPAAVRPEAAVSDIKISDIDMNALIGAAAANLRRFAQESIPVIVAECISSGVVSKAQIAYVLATSEHESLAGKFMRELWGPTDAQRGYEGRADLGNVERGDGFRFRGRGYVQITGRTNYEFWSRRLDVDLIANPDQVSLDPDIAAKITVQGMRDGTFRPRNSLSSFINDDKPDFFNAREIINADKQIVDRDHTRNRGMRIAELAENYLAAMT